MFNEFAKGEFPRYIEYNNYTLYAKTTSSYKYSTTNMGTVTSFGYGTLQSKGDLGAFSAIEFNFIKGQTGGFNYTAGTSFYIHSHYTKGDSFLNYQASVLGSLLYRPNVPYISHGNFTRI